MEDSGRMGDGESGERGSVDDWAFIVLFYSLAAMCGFTVIDEYFNGRLGWMHSFPLMILDLALATHRLRSLKNEPQR